jgi:hypothetical protein
MSLHVFHDVLWEYGSNWCFGLRKDEELLIYEGWHFCKEKAGFWGKRTEEELSILKLVCVCGS